MALDAKSCTRPRSFKSCGVWLKNLKKALIVRSSGSALPFEAGIALQNRGARVSM
jgi:hypothetical protein